MKVANVTLDDNRFLYSQKCVTIREQETDFRRDVLHTTTVFVTQVVSHRDVKLHKAWYLPRTDNTKFGDVTERLPNLKWGMDTGLHTGLRREGKKMGTALT